MPKIPGLNRGCYGTDSPYEMHRNESRLDTIISSQYWEALCPSLTCSVEHMTSRIERPSLDTAECLFLQERLSQKGFFQLSKRQMGIPVKIIDALAKSVIQLKSFGWPASFIFIFDEVWEIIRVMREDLRVIGGGNDFVGDVYAWCVDPNINQKGWGPHRDRMGTGPSSFKTEKNIPMLSTTWLALTDATPKNSCLYVIPADIDPLYNQQDDPSINPLQEVFKDPNNFQDITCLSCRAGEANHFSHRIIHWGSLGIPDKDTKPRIALSWVNADKNLEEPCFDLSALPFPSLEQRLGLICGQMINYSGQTHIKKGFRDLCFRIFKRTSISLGVDFRDKVTYLYFMRPPPRKLTISKKIQAQQKKQIVIEELVMPSEEEKKSVVGIKDMFLAEGESDSSHDSSN